MLLGLWGLWVSEGGALATAEAALQVDRGVLDNGMTVLVAERRGLPMVALKLVLRAGAVAEPADRPGLATLTAQLLLQGTSTRSAEQIAEAVDQLGGAFTVTAQHDVVAVELAVLKQDLPTALDLLADVLLRPAFHPDEIARKVKQLQAYLLRLEEQPRAVARRTFNELLFGPHPYGRPLEGTQEGLARITEADVRDFYRRLYTPRGAILAASGEITRAELVDALRPRLASWQPAPAGPPPIPAPRPPQGRVVKVINRDLQQANIVMGHLGLPRTDPDYEAVSVMNYILGGGGFASRLMQVIRERGGLAYSVRSGFDGGLLHGAFRVEMQTQNPTANRAVELALQEIERMRTTPVAEQDLEEGRAFLIGSFPQRLSSNGRIVDFLTDVELYGLGLDYAEQYPRRLRALTREEIQRVAAKYLHPQDIVLVVVADEGKAQLR